MKRFIICVILSCSALICAACENQSDLTDNGILNDKDKYSDAESSLSEFITEVSKENFIEIPNEAIESFNYVSEASKVIFNDISGKWMYGYKGIQKINGKNCHVFTIYSETADQRIKAGTLAKSNTSTDLFILDNATGKYKSTIFSDKTDASWANTPTVTLVKN
ncbi:MAG: hypothetical protein K2F81_02870 [Ruminococcus sp.]|nr:hypothetical protein [Ruminococcus sp.]